MRKLQNSNMLLFFFFFPIFFRYSNLILNLFSLMVDANIPDIALEPDKTVKKVNFMQLRHHSLLLHIRKMLGF